MQQLQQDRNRLTTTKIHQQSVARTQARRIFHQQARSPTITRQPLPAQLECPPSRNPPRRPTHTQQPLPSTTGVPTIQQNRETRTGDLTQQPTVDRSAGNLGLTIRTQELQERRNESEGETLGQQGKSKRPQVQKVSSESGAPAKRLCSFVPRKSGTCPSGKGIHPDRSGGQQRRLQSMCLHVCLFVCLFDSYPGSSAPIR